MDRTKFRRVGRHLGLLVCFAGAVVYASLAIRSYAAYHFYTKDDYDKTRRAVALEPTNAAYRGLLSKEQLLLAPDPLDSLKQAEMATALNSYDARSWLNLALTYHTLGRDEDARAATRRAIAADPTTPDVAWTAGNVFLLASDPAEALQQFAIVLKHSQRNVQRTLDLSWRMFSDVKAIEQILPPDPDVYLPFLQILVSKHETEAAAEIWSSMVQQNFDFDFHRALFYVDYLIAEHDAAQATSVWKTLSEKSKALAQYSESGNLIVDSKFHQDILNSAFDWHYVPVTNISVALQRSESSPDAHSVCITYDGANGNAGIYETVPVEAPGEYTLSALVKSENIHTANGPTITISDAYDDSVLVSTEPTSGTTDWHPISAHFTVAPNTKLITIAIRRDPGGTMIKGLFCAEGLAVRPAGQSTTTAAN